MSAQKKQVEEMENVLNDLACGWIPGAWPNLLTPMAKHVLGLIIQARIDTINNFADLNDPCIRSHWIEYQSELEFLKSQIGASNSG